MPSEAETHVYRFGERIHIGNADRFFAEITPYVSSPEISHIVLDLENVRECCSYGLKLFLNLQRLVESNNRTLLLYRPSAILRDLFSTTRLDHVFAIVDSLESDEHA